MSSNNINIEELRRLLDRYYNGVATEEEEARLRDRLMQEDVPDEFRADVDIFRAESAVTDVPEDLEARLSKAIDGWNAQEQVNDAVARRGSMLIAGWRRVASIAASVALVVAIGITMNLGKERVPADTFSDPQEAYAATEKALLIFAKAINRGVDGVEMAERVSDSAISTAMNEMNAINQTTITQ